MLFLVLQGILRLRGVGEGGERRIRTRHGRNRGDQRGEGGAEMRRATKCTSGGEVR